jgi:acetyl-CoA C-acetyltransferase
MAHAANQLAMILGISKAEQDAWAIASHQAALSAPTDHIVELLGVTDDPFKRELSERHCARAPKVTGSISAANMSVAADGAAFVVVASSQWAKARRSTGVDLLGGLTIGGNPEMPGLAPIEAINQSLSSVGIGPGDLLSVEIMEAFAAQAIACVDGAGIDPSIVNSWGGSLARGHPIGASGAVLAVQLFHRVRTAGGIGSAAIAAAGGLGSAMTMAT